MVIVDFELQFKIVILWHVIHYQRVIRNAYRLWNLTKRPYKHFQETTKAFGKKLRSKIFEVLQYKTVDELAKFRVFNDDNQTAYNFLKKTPTKVFPCEIYETFSQKGYLSMAEFMLCYFRLTSTETDFQKLKP